MSLVARHLEANGIPTVILGSARDVVEHCGVPRFAFTDFPLGNPCGSPWDQAQQHEVIASALGLFEEAHMPRTTVRLPQQWPGDDGWRESYLQVRPADLPTLRRMGEERRAERRRRREQGLVRTE